MAHRDVENPIIFTAVGQQAHTSLRIMSVCWHGSLEEGHQAIIGHNRGGIFWSWTVPTQPPGGPSTFFYSTHTLLAGADGIPTRDGINCERLDGGILYVYWQER
jgi:hypothetical protein